MVREWTEEEINKIIDLKGTDGKLINIFDLYGVLFVGTCQRNPVTGKSEWNIRETFQKFSSASIGFDIEDFACCEDEQDVKEVFSELLKERVKEELA